MTFKKNKIESNAITATGLSKEFNGLNIAIYGSNQTGMSSGIKLIFKIKKNKITGVNTIYADFSEGLRLGLESGPAVKISVEALKLLRNNLNANIWIDSEENELEAIQKELISDLDLKVLNKTDFYYGFWLGVYNYVTRAQ